MVGVAAGIPTILTLVFAVILAVVCVLRWKNYSWNQVTTSHLLEGLPSITFLLPSLVDLHSRNLIQHPLRLSGSLGPLGTQTVSALSFKGWTSAWELKVHKDKREIHMKILKGHCHLLTIRKLKKTPNYHHCFSVNFSVISHRKPFTLTPKWCYLAPEIIES